MKSIIFYSWVSLYINMALPTYVVIKKDGTVVERTGSSKGQIIDKNLSGYTVVTPTGEKQKRYTSTSNNKETVVSIPVIKEGVASSKYEVTRIENGTPVTFSRTYQRIGSNINIVERRAVPLTARDFFINYDQNMKGVEGRKFTNAALSVSDGMPRNGIKLGEVPVYKDVVLGVQSVVVPPVRYAGKLTYANNFFGGSQRGNSDKWLDFGQRTYTENNFRFEGSPFKDKDFPAFAGTLVLGGVAASGKVGAGIVKYGVVPAATALGVVDFVKNPSVYKAAQTAVIASPLLVRGAEFGYDIFKTKGLSKVPVESIATPEAIAGKFPQTKGGADALIKDFATSPYSEKYRTGGGEIAFKTIPFDTQARIFEQTGKFYDPAITRMSFPKSSGGFSLGPQPLDYSLPIKTTVSRPSDSAGLYVGSDASLNFLGTGEGTRIGLLPSFGRPTATFASFGANQVERIPFGVRILGLKASQNFLVSEKVLGSGKIYLTAASEVLGKTENEAVISGQSGLFSKGSRDFFVFNGRRVPIVETVVTKGFDLGGGIKDFTPQARKGEYYFNELRSGRVSYTELASFRPSVFTSSSVPYSVPISSRVSSIRYSKTISRSKPPSSLFEPYTIPSPRPSPRPTPERTPRVSRSSVTSYISIPSSIVYIPSSVRIPSYTPPPSEPFSLYRRGGGGLFGSQKYKSFFAGVKSKYTPSVEALVFNIKGKKSLSGEKTGIGLRPIPLKLGA